jgi:hypothetical protein
MAILEAQGNEEADKAFNSIRRNWSWVLYQIIVFCDLWKIDITSHVAWKAKYNATRERLHGKAY